MSNTRESILQALRDVRLIDPHSHINPHQPASTTLADILGYHYYTELVHSSGTAKHEIESADLSPRELVGRLVKGLHHLSNTAQHAWLLDICSRFFGFTDDVIDSSNWETLFESAESTMQHADWADTVLEKSNVEGVFLTNDFDDKLSGFDTKKYIPCLRTDDLVFHLSKSEVRDRLAICSGIDIDGSLKSLRDAIEQRFEHFVSHGARACAISLPPDFSPAPISDGRATTALDAILRAGSSADESHKTAIGRRVFWTIVELCDQFRLPMDLMIGVNRGVYADGVFQGRDLYDSRVSLIQYRELFNTFPDVKFPISVLASVTNQELVSYAWIFPNVITNGHWWYSNTPSFVRRDAAARLEAVPRNKQIGYYSDAYKLEFIAPKFDMYRRILAGILFDDFVVERGWSEEKAIDLGRQILRGNVDILFPDRSSDPNALEPPAHAWSDNDELRAMAPALSTATLLSTETTDSKATPGIYETLHFGESDLLADESGANPGDSVNMSEVDIRYFRADEMDDLRQEDAFSLDDDDDSMSLFPDPITGELRMASPATDEASEESLEETYLLHAEPETEQGPELSLTQDVEPIDFDELELTSLDDDRLEVKFSTEDDFVEETAFDPAQTLDLDAPSQQDDPAKE